MENWIWGLSLIALTTAVHATGIAFMALALGSIRVGLENRSRRRWRYVFTVMMGLLGAVGLLLAVLHGIEAAVWAAAYWWLGALDAPEAAMLYSIDSISTRGASGLMVEQSWRMMGALEAIDGMLLFGISTAFVFAVMQAFWSLITRGRPHEPDQLAAASLWDPGSAAAGQDRGGRTKSRDISAAPVAPAQNPTSPNNDAGITAPHDLTSKSGEHK